MFRNKKFTKILKLEKNFSWKKEYIEKYIYILKSDTKIEV